MRNWKPQCIELYFIQMEMFSEVWGLNSEQLSLFMPEKKEEELLTTLVQECLMFTDDAQI